MANVTLAAANLAVHQDKERNLRRILELIGEAEGRGANILVLPEMCLQGYPDFGIGSHSQESTEQKQYYFRESEPIPGPSTEIIRQSLERSRMLVQVGLAETALNGNVIYNSTALIGPTGVLGVYRKVHNPFEYPYFYPGDATPVFDTPYGRVASIICYDLCFPELLRAFALKGADVVLMSNAWPMKGNDRQRDYYGWAMDLAAQSQAFFNQSWLVVSNHCEKTSKFDYYGGSQIVDAYGQVVAYLADEEGLVLHTADLQLGILQSRTGGFFGHNLLRDRRPDRYENLVDAISTLDGLTREASIAPLPVGKTRKTAGAKAL